MAAGGGRRGREMLATRVGKIGAIGAVALLGGAYLATVHDTDPLFSTTSTLDASGGVGSLKEVKVTPKKICEATYKATVNKASATLAVTYHFPLGIHATSKLTEEFNGDFTNDLCYQASALKTTYDTKTKQLYAVLGGNDPQTNKNVFTVTPLRANPTAPAFTESKNFLKKAIDLNASQLSIFPKTGGITQNVSNVQQQVQGFAELAAIQTDVAGCGAKAMDVLRGDAGPEAATMQQVIGSQADGAEYVWDSTGPLAKQMIQDLAGNPDVTHVTGTIDPSNIHIAVLANVAVSSYYSQQISAVNGAGDDDHKVSFPDESTVVCNAPN